MLKIYKVYAKKSIKWDFRSINLLTLSMQTYQKIYRKLIALWPIYDVCTISATYFEIAMFIGRMCQKIRVRKIWDYTELKANQRLQDSPLQYTIVSSSSIVVSIVGYPEEMETKTWVSCMTMTLMTCKYICKFVPKTFFWACFKKPGNIMINISCKTFFAILIYFKKTFKSKEHLFIFLIVFKCI